MPNQCVGWLSSVGCDSFRDESYKDIITSGNNGSGTYRMGTKHKGTCHTGTYRPCTIYDCQATNKKWEVSFCRGCIQQLKPLTWDELEAAGVKQTGPAALLFNAPACAGERGVKGPKGLVQEELSGGMYSPSREEYTKHPQEQVIAPTFCK